jgi:hypothetical protein
VAVTIEDPGLKIQHNAISFDDFEFGIGCQKPPSGPGFDVSPTTDVVTGFVTESADDGSPDGAYLSLLTLVLDSSHVPPGTTTTGFLEDSLNIPTSFFEAHVGTTITYELVLNSGDLNTGLLDGQAIETVVVELLPDRPDEPSRHPFNNPQAIQNDYFAITRLQLSSDDAATENQAIVDKATTERIFVDGLLSQVQNTTIPAIAVEGSMYGAVGTSDEITLLVTSFLPAQVQNAIKNDLNPQVYACEALGLAFAFADENKGTAFADKFGPTAPGMSSSPSGDSFFGTAAANAIFGSGANANTPGAIQQFVSNWEAFYTSHGVPGIPNSTPDQIIIAARGAAWGDAVGVALANELGPLPLQVINFIEDAARGGALYSKSLASQPTHVPFQGGIPEFGTSSAGAEPVGLAALDHSMV